MSTTSDHASAEIHWAQLTAPEVREHARAGAIALWPVGSTEQHGDHLVTGFDLRSAEAVCKRAADSIRPIAVVLPGQPVGASEHWLALGATLSIRPSTLSLLVLDLLRSVSEAGFRHLVIVNGHAGNVGPIASALGEFRDTSLRARLISYWELVDPERLRAESVTDEGGIGHAGEIETSIGLYLDERLVDQACLPAPAGRPLLEGVPGSRRPVFARTPRPTEESPGGVYGDPGPARAELGRLVIESASQRLADHCRAAGDSSQ